MLHTLLDLEGPTGSVWRKSWRGAGDERADGGHCGCPGELIVAGNGPGAKEADGSYKLSASFRANRDPSLDSKTEELRRQKELKHLRK